MYLDDRVYMNQSKPLYTMRHSGTALICGSAETLWDDLDRARKIRPDTWVVGINRTVGLMSCDMGVAIDRQKTNEWWTDPQCPHFTGHSVRPELGKTPEDYPSVTHWWKHLSASGSSSWFAARIARIIGFDEIILCGVPLSPMGYADDKTAPKWDRERAVAAFHRAVTKDRAMHEFTFSMSGWTKELLGAPF